MAHPTILICVVPPDAPAYSLRVDNRTPREVHDLVGGYIELFPLGGELVGICNENGWNQGLPPNCYLPELGIMVPGTFLVAGRDRADPSELRSLSPAEVQYCLLRWSGPRLRYLGAARA